MERIWKLKEVCVNRPCLLNFQNVTGFSALSSTRPAYVGLKKGGEKKTRFSTAAATEGIKLRPTKDSRKLLGNHWQLQISHGEINTFVS